VIYPWQHERWQRFVKAKLQQKIPHAIMLSGVEGLGKNSFASQMAKTVLCTAPLADGNACGQCHSCSVFEAGSHPDHIEIKPEETGKQIKIEQIRNLKDKQQLTPTVSNWKTVVISPAYQMNVNANNSLLKLLEEPEKNTLLILVTSKPHSMPITVKSRCQIVHFDAPQQQQALAWLEQSEVAFEDNSEIKQNVLNLAKGAPLKVIEMLESGYQSQVQQVSSDFEKLVQQGINPVQLASEWLQYDLTSIMNQLYHLMLARISLANKALSSLTQPNDWAIVDCIIQTTKLISSQNNLNKQLLLEGFLVDVSKIVAANKTR
jgi:DNA polymerase-3 subunit delta'